MTSLFATDERFEIVGSGSSATDVLSIAHRDEPDVMIVDLSMPGDVIGAVRDVTERATGVRVVIFTAYEDVDKALRVIDAGAHAYVLKGRPTDDLYDAIRSVSSGEIFVSPGFAQQVMAGFRNRSRRERQLESARLSPREEQIVECLLKAMSNKEIARTLGLSEKTIKHYMTNLMSKLNVKSRLEVVVAAQALASTDD